MKKIISCVFILIAGLQYNVNCSLARTANQVTVTDVCGNKTSMKKLNLNLKKKYANFSYDDIARGAVASDGNFYFLRKEKKGIYKIYKNGKVCKTFKNKEADIYNMIRMDNRYYALGYFYDGCLQIVKLEDEKNKFETLKTDFAVKRVYWESYWKNGCPEIYVWNQKFMSIQTDAKRAMYWAIMAKNGKSLYSGEHVNFTVQMSRNKVFVTRVNNTMYYGITHGKTVKIYKFNIKSRKESLIVKYKRKKNSYDDTIINFDKNYMYYQGDIIPLKGGKLFLFPKKITLLFHPIKRIFII